ncbi:hypothetical protein Moror_13665, partial [Moniliophthora roreri MCA 2997]
TNIDVIASRRHPLHTTLEFARTRAPSALAVLTSSCNVYGGRPSQDYRIRLLSRCVCLLVCLHGLGLFAPTREALNTTRGRLIFYMVSLPEFLDKLPLLYTVTRVSFFRTKHDLGY